MGILEFLGMENNTAEIKDFKQRGALILDVRTKEEFDQGHIANSINIPLQVIRNQESVQQIKSYEKPIIACCRSGNRSGQAARILKEFNIEVINGGAWDELDSLLEQ